MLLKILLGLTVAAEFFTVPVFLKYYWPGRSKKSFTMKMISAALFVLCGFLCVKISANNTPYANLIMWGLVLGFIGDIFLHSLNNKAWHFVLGFISFLAGHIVYIVAFWKAIKSTYPGSSVYEWYELVAIAAIICIMFAIYISKGIFKGKEYFIPAFIIYGFILTSMLLKAIRYSVGEIAYGTNDHMVAVAVTVGVGALLFTVSDLILGYTIPVGKTSRKARIINIATYFMAQILLALSILFVRSDYALY